MPPIENANIKLSMSKPVFAAKLNKDGGFQYFGTKRGSVKPRAIVKILTNSISFLNLALTNQIIIQINKSASDEVNQAFIIAPVYYRMLRRASLLREHLQLSPLIPRLLSQAKL